ncbi:unnamed protein product [Lactuca virosa]|uniref:Uncharacterized protein n=1 Tax=Lactuca virosa TaxID=75947 RepID=A0AAU9MFE3_9ASTR|nr:unnamed protein product [Lactuca virosa]
MRDVWEAEAPTTVVDIISESNETWWISYPAPAIPLRREGRGSDVKLSAEERMQNKRLRRVKECYFLKYPIRALYIENKGFVGEFAMMVSAQLTVEVANEVKEGIDLFLG